MKLRTYRAKLHGPLADRVDIVRHVRPAPPLDPFAPRRTTAELRARVSAARDRQHERYRRCSWRLNAHAPAAALRERWPLDAASTAQIEKQLAEGSLTRRGATRVHRMALTVADLEGRAVVPDDVTVALNLRSGAALESRFVEQAG